MTDEQEPTNGEPAPQNNADALYNHFYKAPARTLGTPDDEELYERFYPNSNH